MISTLGIGLSLWLIASPTNLDKPDARWSNATIPDLQSIDTTVLPAPKPPSDRSSTQKDIGTWLMQRMLMPDLLPPSSDDGSIDELALPADIRATLENALDQKNVLPQSNSQPAPKTNLTPLRPDHSSAQLKHWEAQIKNDRELPKQQRIALTSLIQFFDERPDDAYITLKTLDPESFSTWHRLQELFLAERLGLEGEVRELGNDLKERWFPRRLSVPKIEFCSAVRAFGDYDTLGNTLNRGAWTLVYIEIKGLDHHSESSGFHRQYRIDFEVKDESGRLLDSYSSPEDFKDFSRSQFEDTYVWIKWQAKLPPGPYTMTVTVDDDVGARKTSVDKSFFLR